MFCVRNKLTANSVKPARINLVFIRLKSNKKNRNTSCSRALAHFDNFYKGIFQEKWPSVRLGLLSKPKTIAVINNLGQIDKTKDLLRREGAIDLKKLLKSAKRKDKQSERLNESTESTVLSDVITKKLQEEEEKEFKQLHPEGKNLKFKSESDCEDVVYEDEVHLQPDILMSSMHSTLNAAEFDKSRLIVPDSPMGNAPLFEFVPATQLRGTRDFIAESEYYKYYEAKTSQSVNVEEEHELHFPEHLNVFSFDRGDVSEFPPAGKCVNNVDNFFTIDGGELLAALALGVKPEDYVLDLCSTSGNISACIFQTFYPKILACQKRKHVEDIFERCLENYSPSWKNMLMISNQKYDYEMHGNLFDKILVDVVSTNDRNSLFEEEDNIFAIPKTKFRLQLPELQCGLLTNALKLVRPGGAVLYTTATLSPIQNDGVVNEALRVLQSEERGMKFTVKDLSPALEGLSYLYNFGNYLKLKYGTLVVPFTPLNFGPRYFCKIEKQEGSFVNNETVNVFEE